MAFSSARAALPAIWLLVMSLTVIAQTTPAPSTTPAGPVAPTPATVGAAAAANILLRPELVQGSYKDYLTKRYAADREACAVVHMFGRKQVGGALWLGGGAAFASFLISQTGTTSTGTGTRTLKVSPLGYVIFIGLPAVLGINKLSRFGKGALFKVLTEYDKSLTFPRFVSARVHQSDYR